MTASAGGVYDDRFYAAIDPESAASARAVLPRVVDLVRPRVVIDVGCGSGAWMRAFRELGVDDVHGVDGAHVPTEFRLPGRFTEHDLLQPLDVGRRFDLAVCLELGEHLPFDRAAGLVADLVRMAPLVLFSAAVPGQGGTDHVNEQWPEYWTALFAERGWTCRDAIRPWIRSDEAVAWWYRQNIFLAADPASDAGLRAFPVLPATRPVHPVDYRGPLPPPPVPSTAAPAAAGPADAPVAPTLAEAATLAGRALRGTWGRGWTTLARRRTPA